MAGIRRKKNHGRFWFIELFSLDELKEAEEYVANDPDLKHEHFETLQSPDREGHYLFCMALPSGKPLAYNSKCAWEKMKISLYLHPAKDEG